eukprot:215332-Prymnesium_polylepis.1
MPAAFGLFGGVLSWGRQGCACCRSSGRGRAGAVWRARASGRCACRRVAGVPVECLGLWIVRTVLCLHCSALVMHVYRVGNAKQRVADVCVQHSVAVLARPGAGRCMAWRRVLRPCALGYLLLQT